MDEDNKKEIPHDDEASTSSSSSDCLDYREIPELREKALEIERLKDEQSNNVHARTKPFASSLPGGNSYHSNMTTNGENGLDVAQHRENELHRERAASRSVAESTITEEHASLVSARSSRVQSDPSKNPNPIIPSKDTKLVKSGLTGAVSGEYKRRLPTRHSSAESSSVVTEVHECYDLEDVVNDCFDSVEENETILEESSNERYTLPGAYAHDGPGISSDRERQDSAVAEVLAALGVDADRDDNGNDAPRIFQGDLESRIAQEEDSDMLKATKVDDAEPIFQAQDVKNDYLRRNLTVSFGSLAVASIVLIVSLVVLLPLVKKDLNTDPCAIPAKEQSVARRCNCTGTTDNFYDELDDLGQRTYTNRLEFLQANGIIDKNFSMNKYSCDPLNQNLLIQGNITDNSPNGKDLIGIRDPLKMSFFVFIHIYLTMGGLSWDNTDEWLTDDLCNWFGVSCIFLDLIHQISLPSNGLQGTLPTYIGFLTNIRVMDLSGNSGIKGTIPSEIGQMTQLEELILTASGLTGEIPSELGKLTQVDEMALGSNGVTGTIPRDLFALTQLRQLDLGHNELTGKLPPEVGNATLLVELEVGGNRLTGTLPTELGRLTQLELLGIQNNSFTGDIPDFLGKMSDLELFFMYKSGLAGKIPYSFCDNAAGKQQIKIVVECPSGTLPECSCCSKNASDTTVQLVCLESVPWLELEGLTK